MILCRNFILLSYTFMMKLLMNCVSHKSTVKMNASTGNRTQTSRVETEYSTIKLQMLGVDL